MFESAFTCVKISKIISNQTMSLILSHLALTPLHKRIDMTSFLNDDMTRQIKEIFAELKNPVEVLFLAARRIAITARNASACSKK